MGKTTIASALVRDEVIRGSFEKLVWVSVGQQPDIRELQESIFGQLTRRSIPESAKTPDLVEMAIRDAAKGSKVLLVLDDLWDAKYEKPLNIIDGDNASRLLVTTRIRSLLKNSSEVDVGLLSAANAYSLLVSSADMAEEDLDKESDEYQIAVEIVELCGRLPLALAIAGGTVSDSSMGFSQDILDVMKESPDLEDEEGLSLENRVITSSLTMIKGKNKTLAEKSFYFFAVFPEDVPIPAAFFDKMVPLLNEDDKASEQMARVKMRAAITTLLKYNLLKGSLLPGGSGVFMHDIVRDYVIGKHSEGDLRALQRTVVDTVLAARPEPDGFPPSKHAATDSFEGFAARQLYWHMRGSLQKDEEPPDTWITHQDDVVKANVAMAVGADFLLALSTARENAGELVRAAEASWAARFAIDDRAGHDRIIYRTAELLETADCAEAWKFECLVLATCVLSTTDLPRAGKCRSRYTFLVSSMGEAAPPIAKMFLALNEASAKFNMFTADGRFAKTTEGDCDIEGGLEARNKCAQYMMELSDANPSRRSFHENLSHPHFIGSFIVASVLPQWDPGSLGCTEQGMVKAIEFYQYHVCGPALKGQRGIDIFRAGCFVSATVFWYGNLDAIVLWHEKVLAAFVEIDLPTTGLYAEEYSELIGVRDGLRVPL